MQDFQKQPFAALSNFASRQGSNFSLTKFWKGETQFTKRNFWTQYLFFGKLENVIQFILHQISFSEKCIQLTRKTKESFMGLFTRSKESFLSHSLTIWLRRKKFMMKGGYAQISSGTFGRSLRGTETWVITFHNYPNMTFNTQNLMEWTHQKNWNNDCDDQEIKLSN